MHSHANRRLKTARATVPGADRAPKPSTAAEPGLQTPNSSQSTAHNTIQAAAIEPMPVASLRPYPGNPRTHFKKQVRQIADSIREFGFNNPVLIGEDGGIIAGHGRVEAAKLLGLDSSSSRKPAAACDTKVDRPGAVCERSGWSQQRKTVSCWQSSCRASSTSISTSSSPNLIFLPLLALGLRPVRVAQSVRKIF
jgi:ParB-like nuclease domain